MDTEGLWLVGYGDVAFDHPVTVDCAILFELETSFGPLDLAGQLSQGWHDDDGRLRRERCQREHERTAAEV